MRRPPLSLGAPGVGHQADRGPAALLAAQLTAPGTPQHQRGTWHCGYEGLLQGGMVKSVGRGSLAPGVTP